MRTFGNNKHEPGNGINRVQCNGANAFTQIENIRSQYIVQLDDKRINEINCNEIFYQFKDKRIKRSLHIERPIFRQNFLK
mgnify:CR=1 FL=1